MINPNRNHKTQLFWVGGTRDLALRVRCGIPTQTNLKPLPWHMLLLLGGGHVLGVPGAGTYLFFFMALGCFGRALATPAITVCFSEHNLALPFRPPPPVLFRRHSRPPWMYATADAREARCHDKAATSVIPVPERPGSQHVGATERRGARPAVGKAHERPIGDRHLLADTGCTNRNENEIEVSVIGDLFLCAKI